MYIFEDFFSVNPDAYEKKKKQISDRDLNIQLKNVRSENHACVILMRLTRPFVSHCSKKHWGHYNIL